jgi:hypothetical protein
MTEDTNSSSKQSVSIFWPLFLVIVGFIFLLNNFNIIPWSIWKQLSPFWPVLLIFSGLEILLGKSKSTSFFITVLGLVVFGLILFLTIPDLAGILIKFRSFNF